jgi:hypothetical protein
MSSFALLKVYNSVIFPHLNYCCTIWSGAKNAANIDKIFKLKKKAANQYLLLRVWLHQQFQEQHY